MIEFAVLLGDLVEPNHGGRSSLDSPDRKVQGRFDSRLFLPASMWSGLVLARDTLDDRRNGSVAVAGTIGAREDLARHRS